MTMLWAGRPAHNTDRHSLSWPTAALASARPSNAAGDSSTRARGRVRSMTWTAASLANRVAGLVGHVEADELRPISRGTARHY
jgi:hypothetical protein